MNAEERLQPPRRGPGALLGRCARWVAPGVRSDRAELLVGVVMVGVVVSAATVVIEASQFGLLQPGVGFLVAFAALTTGLLLTVRWGVPFALVAWAELALVAIFLIAMSLVPDRFIASQLYWFSLLPMCGGLAQSRRGVWGGLAMALTSIAAVVLLRQHGVHGNRAPTDGELQADVVLFVAGLGGIGAVYEGLRARAIAQFEAAAQARTVFFASLSHELRTPMNGVLGMAQILEGDQLTDAQRRTLAMLRKSGETMVSLVNDILDFARLESGAMPLELRPTDLRALVEETRSLLAPAADQRGLTLAVNLDAAVPGWLRLDPLRVRQVLLNLLGNAIKFSPRGASVSVDLSWRSGVLAGQVLDRGIGIEPNVLKTLFVPFSQGDASTARRFGGSGLGLSITRDLCRLMQGRLWAVSSPGEGSTFFFEVRADAVAAPLQSLTPVRTPVHFSGRLLVVEDNEINQLVTRALCERLGFTVEVVSDGATALQRGREPGWRAILMDCQIPEVDGLEVTRRLRAAGVTVPILGVSASSGSGDLRRCLDAGMNGLVSKPLLLDGLRAAFESLPG